MGKVSAYFGAQVEAGVLDIADTELAAAQFLDMCQSTIMRAMLFGASDAPTPERIAEVVEAAVDVFMAAYAAKTLPAG
jgi:TetR/AcrR family transcriptional regulator of autoinduction and epiphytic fitness